MDTTTIGILGSALDLGSTRLQTIANNLSNVNTPGYKRKDVSFAALMEETGARQDDQIDLAPQQTNARHLALDSNSDLSRPAIITEGGDAMRADGNNVDVDAEGARLAAAQVYYQGATQLLQNQFSNLKYVISGGR